MTFPPNPNTLRRFSLEDSGHQDLDDEDEDALSESFRSDADDSIVDKIMIQSGGKGRFLFGQQQHQQHDEDQEEQEELQDEVKQVTKRETKYICIWRVVMALVIIGSGAVVLLGHVQLFG